MKIIENFAAEIPDDPEQVDLLKQEASFFLKKTEGHWVEVLSERTDKMLSAATLEEFFRNQERSEQVSRTLQYLLGFLSHIPDPRDIAAVPVNPAEQFREFIRYQVDLLLEKDVRGAVFREINNLGSLNDGNVWDYQEQIFSKNRELRKLVGQDNGTVAKTIAASCQALEKLSLFWLEIKRGDLQRTRRSDIYLYRLSRIVKDRCQQMQVG
ncbi:MAG: hypothetical protein NTW95_06285 [Candidatus Aminicenantes bacterium]|nr:hypothetical protein [Candidatus Aminicenantes bacterium]